MNARLATLRRRTQELFWGRDYDREDGRCRQGPEWLVLVINNFCNLRCRMCDVGLGESASVFYHHLIGDDPRNMTLALLERLLDQAAAFSPRPRIGLAYTEPLIHREIVAFCRTIVERGFFCSVTTNGFMLPRLARALVESGLHEIVISVDGPEAVHDRVRGREGSFRNLYQGIEALQEARGAGERPVVRLSYTLTDQNYRHLVAFARQVEPLRPASINFSHLNFISEEMASSHNALYGHAFPVSRSNLGEMELAAFDIEAMWAEIGALKAYAASHPGFPPITIVPDVTTPEGLARFYQEPQRFMGGRACTDPWRMAMVRTDGTVVPAHGRCYDVPIGKIEEQPLAELWNNEPFRAFRRTLQEAGGALPACARCCGVIGKAAEPELKMEAS